MDHWGFSVSPHHHLLLLQLFRHLDESEEQGFKNTVCWKQTHNTGCLKVVTTYIFRWGARDFNPGFGEKGTWSKHEDDVDDCMDWVVQNRAKWLRGREVVTESTYRVGTGWATWRCVLQTWEKNTSFNRRKHVVASEVNNNKKRITIVHLEAPSPIIFGHFWRLILRRKLNKLNWKVWLNVYLQTKYRGD